jgi:CRP-like cAMP-binding protein
MHHAYPLISNIVKYIKLTEDEKRIITNYWELKTIPKKGYLLKSGQICNRDSFVLDGMLKSYFIDQNGKENVIFIAIEGWWATDLDSFYHEKFSDFNIQAIGKSSLLQITRKNFENLITSVPILERYFRVILQNYTVSLQRRITLRASQSAFERYQTFLRQYPIISKKAPLKDIASYLDMSPELLSKIRSGKHH